MEFVRCVQYNVRARSTAALGKDDLRKLVPRVVLEKDFRKSLISDYPELPKIWERHLTNVEK